jgi:hypothetical protein
VAARGAEWAKGVFFGGRPDDGDALGQSGFPLVDPVTAAAALIGLGMAVRGWRRPACAVLLAAVLVLPCGALLTINDGLYRRTFGLAPLLAVLAALPLAWLWDQAVARRSALRVVAAAAGVAAVAAAGLYNAYQYFGPFQDSPKVRSVFPYQLDAAVRAVARLPAGASAYLYSDRWNARFETIRWLAPQARLINRSREFRGTASDAELDLSLNQRRATAFVLLGLYLPVSEELHRRYPDALVTEESRGSEVLYRILYVRKAKRAAPIAGTEKRTAQP